MKIYLKRVRSVKGYCCSSFPYHPGEQCYFMYKKYNCIYRGKNMCLTYEDDHRIYRQVIPTKADKK